MHLRLAAMAACLLFGVAMTPPTAAAELMTLDDAFARVAQTHPELRLVDARATMREINLEQIRAGPALKGDVIAALSCVRLHCQRHGPDDPAAYTRRHTQTLRSAAPGS